MPYNFRRYDLPFLHWLAWTEPRRRRPLGRRPLRRSGAATQLARAYDLIVFPGHHEYVTTHEYDVVRRYRDLGGNLAFLSANNFFWQVVRHGNTIERTQQWRDLGRPEAVADRRRSTAATTAAGTAARGSSATPRRAPWLFAGTGLRRRLDASAIGGIEIDKTAPASPPGTKVLAEIPNLFGPGFTAQMTYYRTTPARRSSPPARSP